MGGKTISSILVGKPEENGPIGRIILKWILENTVFS
jgi:hypothetical protein